MAVTAALVKQLRETSGAGMMDCKKALDESDGNVDKAIEWLRKKGINTAQKKSSRSASEGLVTVNIKENIGVVDEINSETDFVARNEEFQNMINNILDHSEGKNTLNDILNTNIEGRNVDQILIDKVSSIGENISIRRMKKISGNNIGFYVHNSVSSNLGKIVVAVSLSNNDEALAKQIAMHIAASNPVALSEKQLPDELIKREEKLYFEQVRESGKPENILENIVKGKMKKFINEVTLLNQNFVIDPDNTIKQVLNNKNNDILDYVRFEVGEGIEKNTEDFTDEVMKTISN